MSAHHETDGIVSILDFRLNRPPCKHSNSKCILHGRQSDRHSYFSSQEDFIKNIFQIIFFAKHYLGRNVLFFMRKERTHVMSSLPGNWQRIHCWRGTVRASLINRRSHNTVGLRTINSSFAAFQRLRFCPLFLRNTLSIKGPFSLHLQRLTLLINLAYYPLPFAQIAP